MFKSKNLIFSVSLAVLALLILQGLWLYRSFKQETKLLEASVRQATHEALAIVEQQEDLQVLESHLGTLLNLVPSPKKQATKTQLKIVVSRNNHVILSNMSDASEKKVSSYAFSHSTNDTSSSPTIEQIFISDTDERVEAKAKDYEKLFKKIVLQTRYKNLDMQHRIPIKQLQALINNKLLLRGIPLLADLAVVTPRDSILFKTKAFTLVHSFALPLFTKDIVNRQYSLRVSYPHGINYLLGKGAWLILLSVLITLLLIFTLVILYQRMRNEERLNQYKNDFINNLTHELKTPLATIALANLNIGNKATQLHEEPILNYTRIIAEENNRLNSHIEKVLELSLLENLNTKPTELVDVNVCIENAVAHYTWPLQNAHAQLAINLANQALTVRGNAFHFTNVIGNLIDNAIKYCQDKPIIRIETSETKEGVCVQVSDKGIGIAAEHQLRVFDKFFRVTHQNLHSVKGFGMGLSYAKQIIETMNGTLHLNSEKDKGSTFIIYLPYAKN